MDILGRKPSAVPAADITVMHHHLRGIASLRRNARETRDLIPEMEDALMMGKPGRNASRSSVLFLTRLQKVEYSFMNTTWCISTTQNDKFIPSDLIGEDTDFHE